MKNKHHCLPISAIVAHRVSGKFSTHPEKTIDNLIKMALEKITSLHQMELNTQKSPPF
jgi:hypothetical protein